ncbi:hypothetical protein O1611_g199 [Lasiodiplodia mahajangana]|uniref:Uncharacterized protein n=1 Tax=Lasiodiplodia mahajangana TaxID=1108764 RepID=A0ACC2K1Q5_9PEZI|nr:hypothetical protein O1611_g199 [Lasiodiplodia mahajangana]
MGNSGQGISAAGFVAVLWTLTAVTTVLFFGRLLIRSILVKSFHLDDIFGAVAWFVTVVAIILATIINPLNYKSGAIIVGEAPTPPEAELENIMITLRKWNFAGQILFWTGLYCAKLSFLFLYRVVFGSHNEYRYVWFAALTYIVLSFGICLIGVFGQCGEVQYIFSYEKCNSSYAVSLDLKLVWVDYFFNLTSDLAVAILPIPIIWRLNMHIKQKLAVTGIFGLAAITIAFETLRTVKLYSEDFTLTNLYSYLELVVSVLLSMLPSYRFLVSPTDKDREYRRLFWSRVTLRSYHSASSDYSMHSLGRRGDDTEIGQGPASSLPGSNRE